MLLLSMPDSFEHVPAVAIRMPNGALGLEDERKTFERYRAIRRAERVYL
ncbi:MAG TPA: hypothetical protein VET45_20700 [Candidatus Binatia bacterium]|nr:hypothetical protein [Candidatus Binatia bacterium]